MANLGLTDQNPYPIRTCAYVDADGWRDNGWMTSDLTEGERQAWHKEVSDFIAKQPDDGRCFSLLELTKESCDKTDIYTAVFQETRSSS